MSLVKFELEFVLHVSPSFLFDKFSTPTGLQEWFADDVNNVGKEYTFTWDGVDEKAVVLSERSNESIKFKWEDSEDDESYFEFKVMVDDLTKDVSLVITDFAPTYDEVEEVKQLWESQVEALKSSMGV